VWVNDHLAAFPAGAEHYPYHPSGRIDWDPRAPQYEALSVCAFVAAASTRLRVGTAVLVLPQRHPVEVSKAAATLAELSDGRFVLGVGAGWSRREMALLGWDPATRGARLDEELRLLVASWRPAQRRDARPLALRLAHYDLPADAILEPAPPPHLVPPILVGGTSPAALDRVRRHRTGWLPVAGPDPARLAELAAALAELRADRPATPAVLKIALDRPDAAAAARIAGRVAGDGWDEVCFEFARWDLDGARAVVDASAARLDRAAHV
jgi:alkanesulfonate monooxygenase SsuD/methylene tetrahydromethanopterin reductase-like flavin-dependent oxidoreductase (luciferase family)